MVAGHGHHGGAWKVAYADFVTAMMALFIVLWLMNTKQEVQEAIAGYFRDPSGSGASKSSSGGIGGGRAELDKLKEKLETAMRHAPALSVLQQYVEITVTWEGLRVELLEGEHDTFFESGIALPTNAGTEILVILASEIGKLPNKIFIEGHTDSRPYVNRAAYSNWELSTDRANAARRLMEARGIQSGQIAEVRGYADRRLRKPEEPENASNRRVSIVVAWGNAAPPSFQGPVKTKSL